MLDILVPIMAACYFIITLILIGMNITVLPDVFRRIFEEAFGLLQALGVFIDTIVICSCTAFIILVTPTDKTDGLVLMDLLQASMHHHLGQFGVVFIALI